MDENAIHFKYELKSYVLNLNKKKRIKYLFNMYNIYK